MTGKDLLSTLKFNEGYAKFKNGKLETFEEATKDVMKLHYNKFSTRSNWGGIKPFIDFAAEQYASMNVLASQRNLQFREHSIKKHNTKMFNCATTYIDRPEVFKEILYVLLCGSGVGFSVESWNISKLPTIKPINNSEQVIHTVEDSIEGWALAIDALVMSYFKNQKKVVFDYSNIRPKGALIAGEFLAPGPKGLERAIENIRNVFENSLTKGNRLSSLECHDIVCMLSDAVLSGGVRRSALISLFDHDDKEMLKAKTGEWWNTAPWRARANNSAKLLRDQFTEEEFNEYKNYIKQFGEPGFVMVNDIRTMVNPCVEISFIPINPKTGNSCWSFCNLTEIIGAKCESKDDFFRACKAASILGTLQASYTDFSFLGKDTEELVEWEALIGVSITGIMDNPEILLDPEILAKGAKIVKETNREVADLIGINHAARTTCIKPSGNASVLAKTSSGIHPAYADMYFRTIQLNKETPVAEYLMEYHPEMIEESSSSANDSDIVCYIPINENRMSIKKKDLNDVEFLKKIKIVFENWVKEGTNHDLGWSHRGLTHNVSNTVTVEDWDACFNYIYNNQHSFCGISFMPAVGDKVYHQAPFTEVKTSEQILKEYGTAAMFASGLIVDTLHQFNGNLWRACNLALYGGEPIGGRVEVHLKKDILYRITKFARNHFDSDLEKAVNCLKDVHLLHKWEKINRNLEINPVDFSKINYIEVFTNADELGAIACHGGACEI